jgi:aryl-alcohol dehydrogenase-like predicted oxidoreductase
VEPGIITPGDVAEGVHCMSPRYLEDQIERSLRNMNLECIDIYYLHNPETQLGEVAPGEFKKRLRSAFELLERKVSEGKIRLYGTATWNGYRTPPAVQEHLEIEEIAEIASEAGGGTHHFKVIQFPFNLSMVEAITLKNQTVTGTPTSLLEAADALGISTVASASLLQGRLAQKPPAFVAESLPGLETDAQRAIQFTRSAPGLGVALVGMSRVSHAEENLRLAAIPPAPLESYKKLFESER